MRLKATVAACVLFAFSCACIPQAQSQQQAPQSAQAATPAQQAQAPTPQGPLHVDGNVLMAKAVHMVPPVTPQIAYLAHVSGIVVLHVIVGRDGTVREITYVSGPALLRAAAMNAVKQWRFEPPLLNGEPVEVEGSVPIHFEFYAVEAFAFDTKVRDPGSSHTILTETIEVMGPEKRRDWTDFMSAFEAATTRAWLDAIPASAGDQKGKATIAFALTRDGRIDGMPWLIRSSGNPEIDAATAAAIRKCAPFPDPPQDFRLATAALRVTFAYDHPHAVAASPGAAQ